MHTIIFACVHVRYVGVRSVSVYVCMYVCMCIYIYKDADKNMYVSGLDVNVTYGRYEEDVLWLQILCSRKKVGVDSYL